MANLKIGVPLSMGDGVENDVIKAKDFASDQVVRWCPGCGDYAILKAVQKTLADVGARRSDTVFISGIGCSSRFPYYMSTYGFHTIHGRAPAVATGLKLTRPDLDVWVITGDGDGLSIGGNHLIHILRRNVGVKILLFNNRIYGLTKGQYSPTSERGKVTGSTPWGSIDQPLNPLSVAVGCEGSFVARAIDIQGKHLQATMARAHAFSGTAFVELWQNCNIFNDQTFAEDVAKEVASDRLLTLEHGQPMIFGKERDKGIRMDGASPRVVTIGNGLTADDLLVHDEQAQDASLAFMLSRFELNPGFPAPIGVLRAVERPTYEMDLAHQLLEADSKKGPGELDSLLQSGDVWRVT